MYPSDSHPQCHEFFKALPTLLESHRGKSCPPVALCWADTTYHEAGPSLGGGHLVRSGDLGGDQGLEFLQLLEQGPEEGTVVTGRAWTWRPFLPPGALLGAGAGSSLGHYTRCPCQ